MVCFSVFTRNTLRPITTFSKRWSHIRMEYQRAHSLLHHTNANVSCRKLPLLHPANRGLPSLRSFRTQRSSIQKKDDSKLSEILKPLCFTTAFCGVAFTGAMIWQYENMRMQAHRIMKGINQLDVSSYIPNKKYGFRSQMNAFWNNLSSGQKIAGVIIALNGAVFLMWRLPAMQSILFRYFSCTPGSALSSMVLCAFSHYSLLHFACNMYVLWSFSTVACNMLGKEQFTAVYLSAAAISSMTSVFYKVIRQRAVMSLGASGAILAIIGAVCYSHPEARLSIAFVDQIYPHSFSAKYAISALVVVDMAGLIFGWKVFDHAAHLGGVLFGMWYMKYGKHLTWDHRERVMTAWHKLRGKP